jgi:hypothetical protein
VQQVACCACGGGVTHGTQDAWKVVFRQRCLTPMHLEPAPNFFNYCIIGTDLQKI